MENHIYRINLVDSGKIEFELVNTNDLDPPHDTRELGVWVLDKELELTESLSLPQLESLINYLEDCKRHIENFNRISLENALIKDKSNA